MNLVRRRLICSIMTRLWVIGKTSVSIPCGRCARIIMHSGPHWGECCFTGSLLGALVWLWSTCDSGKHLRTAKVPSCDIWTRIKMSGEMATGVDRLSAVHACSM